VRLGTAPAAGVRDDEDVVPLTQRLDGGHGDADLRPQPGNDQLLAPRSLHDVDDATVFPGVDERAVDRLLVREDVLEALDEVAATFFYHRGQHRGDVERLRGLGQADDVVDDHGWFVAVEIGELEGLVVDEHQDAFLGGKQCFESGLCSACHDGSFCVMG